MPSSSTASGRGCGAAAASLPVSPLLAGDLLTMFPETGHVPATELGREQTPRPSKPGASPSAESFYGEGKMISEEINLVFTGKETTAIAENSSDICFVVKNGNSFVISTGNTASDIEIFNAAGEIVSRNSNVSGQTIFAPESNGLYIINIKSANGTKTFKVMK